MGAAASEPNISARGVPKTACGAKTKSGGQCRRVAGFGTDHLGYGNCKLHGGASPNGRVHAARLHAAALALEYDVEPHEALLRAVGQAANWELVCRLKVHQLDNDDLIVEHKVERDAWGGENATSYTQTSTSADLNVWVKAHIQAVRELASIAKTAIDAGVDERRVRVAEALGGQLADVLGAIFNELNLTVEQRAQAQPVVRRHLELLEGGQAA